jgi:hypothetical protein
MRVIIAGSRTITNIYWVRKATFESGLLITQVVSGCAPGVDQLGEEWAAHVGLPVRKFPADWRMFRAQAGFIRNRQMAENADALIAIWDGRSRGTRHMIETAGKFGLPVYVLNTSCPNPQTQSHGITNENHANPQSTPSQPPGSREEPDLPRSTEHPR